MQRAGDDIRDGDDERARHACAAVSPLFASSVRVEYSRAWRLESLMQGDDIHLSRNARRSIWSEFIGFKK